jgi:flagellar biosynthetic protein FliP
MENLNAGMVFLVFVAIVAFVIGVIARQWRKPARSAGLRVLSTLALGPRERLVEVLQGDEVLVLGVTSQHVQLIDRRQATDSERVIDSRREFSVANRFSSNTAIAFLLILAGSVLLMPTDVVAQNIPLFEAVPSKGGGTSYSVPVQTVLLLTALSFVPAMLMLMTSFTRILIVLSLLRQAMGLVTTPPNAVLVGIALFVTAAVMAPVTDKVYSEAWQPYVAGRITFTEAVDKGVEPVKSFMLRQTRADDLNLFVKLSGKTYAKPEDVPMTTVIPAFAISEIRTAFLIGFVIYLPFLAIDFAVASILTALGMVMVSPITFSLPLKLIVFVLADGWAMLIGGLVDSFKMTG